MLKHLIQAINPISSRKLLILYPQNTTFYPFIRKFSYLKFQSFSQADNVLYNDQIRNRVKKKWEDRKGEKKKTMFFEDKTDFGKVVEFIYQGLE